MKMSYELFQIIAISFGLGILFGGCWVWIVTNAEKFIDRQSHMEINAMDKSLDEHDPDWRG